MGRRIPIELTVMCMVYDGDSILLQNRRSRTGRGSAFRVDTWSRANP